MGKICNCCKIEKDISEFSKKGKNKQGVQQFQTYCKKCVEEKDKNGRRQKIEYKEQRKEYGKQYNIDNKEKIYLNKKDYHIKNRDKILENKREYRKDPDNKQRAKEYMKIYTTDNKEKYYEYRRRNPHIIAWRSMLYRTLSYLGKKKEEHTIYMLGYSAMDLRNHISSLFVEGMSWDNYGEWQIDHIKPLTKFNENDDVKVVNSLSNLQPLWKTDNIRKYNHYKEPNNN